MSTRLFTAHGAAVVTIPEASMLRAARLEMDVLERAHDELVVALESDDVDGCRAACRRLLSIGWRLGEFARASEARS